MAAAICSTFHDAEINRDVVSGGRLADRVEIAVFDCYALLDIVGVQ